MEGCNRKGVHKCLWLAGDHSLHTMGKQIQVRCQNRETPKCQHPRGRPGSPGIPLGHRVCREASAGWVTCQPASQAERQLRVISDLPRPCQAGQKSRPHVHRHNLHVGMHISLPAPAGPVFRMPATQEGQPLCLMALARRQRNLPTFQHPPPGNVSAVSTSLG